MTLPPIAETFVWVVQNVYGKMSSNDCSAKSTSLYLQLPWLKLRFSLWGSLSQSPLHVAIAEVIAYVFSNFSNFWLILGKLWEARSRLYRRQMLQVNNKYSFESSWRDLQDLLTFAPSESDKITAPHSKILLNFVKPVRMFAVFGISAICAEKITGGSTAFLRSPFRLHFLPVLPLILYGLLPLWPRVGAEGTSFQV